MDPKHADVILETVESSRPEGDDGSSPMATLHAVYGALAQGDFKQFEALACDDVELHIRGFGPMEGSWRGRSDVVEATRRNFGLLSDQKPEIEKMVSQGDSVVVLVSESGVLKANGKPYHLRGVQWITFEGGKLKRVDEFLAEVGEAG